MRGYRTYESILRLTYFFCDNILFKNMGIAGNNGFEVVNPLHTWKSERLSFNRFKIEEGNSLV